MKSQTSNGALYSTNQTPKFSKVLASLKRFERHRAAAEKMPLSELKLRVLDLATESLRQSFEMAQKCNFTADQLEKILSITTKWNVS